MKEVKVVEVHNVWTIYGLNPDGTQVEQSIAQMSRPQDWGDKERWHVACSFALTG